MPKTTNSYDRQHKANMAHYQRLIDEIFKAATMEAAAIGSRVDFDASRVFSFDDYPITRDLVKKLLSRLGSGMEAAIVDGVRSEWTLANNKNDELARRVFGDNVGRLTQAQYRRYFSNNDKAREAFLQRKEQGLNLSERVWRYADQFKNDIELGLDIGIRSGLDAPAMARELQQFLQHPDMLFRRVRDEHGMLQLSKRASEFHPGQGVYRSSYKNARKLAATETNMAYHTADHERWQQLDFVVGIEIRLSGNHTCLGRDGKPHEFHDICDELQGRYPKDFKFTGWHPHCRCQAISILKTEKELMEENRAILRGEEPSQESVNAVTDVPDGFKQWVADNEERIARAKTLPYFLRDNEQYWREDYEASKLGRGTAKLGRQATKEAFEAYGQKDAVRPNTYTDEQVENHRAIEKALGTKQGKDMSFFEADEGRGNADSGKGVQFEVNCQCCVVANELRRRGFNVTALGHTDDETSIPYQLGNDLTLAFINKKGNKPQMTKIKSVSELSLEKATSAVGRYIVGYDTKRGLGHVICAERLTTGQLILFDPQDGEAVRLNMDDLEKIEVLKVDGMRFDARIIGSIVRVYE